MHDVNHDLFVKVLTQIEREPQTWDQEMWARRTECGTAFCFAGHAVHITRGDAFRWDIFQADGVCEAAALRGDLTVTVPDAAFEVLGIGDYEGAVMLFCANNTLDDLYRISADLMGIDEQVLRDKVAAEVRS